MKKTVRILYVSLVIALLNGCSNVSMGFDEDSVFYSPEIQNNISHSTEKTSTNTMLHVEPQKINKKDVIPNIKSEDKDIENETSFYYKIDDGE